MRAIWLPRVNRKPHVIKKTLTGPPGQYALVMQADFVLAGKRQFFGFRFSFKCAFTLPICLAGFPVFFRLREMLVNLEAFFAYQGLQMRFQENAHIVLDDERFFLVHAVFPLLALITVQSPFFPQFRASMLMHSIPGKQGVRLFSLWIGLSWGSKH